MRSEIRESEFRYAWTADSQHFLAHAVRIMSYGPAWIGFCGVSMGGMVKREGGEYEKVKPSTEAAEGRARCGMCIEYLKEHKA